MVTTQETVEMAAFLAGRDLTEREEGALTVLCDLALRHWRGRMLEVIPEEDTPLVLAAALTAAAQLSGAMALARPAVTAFAAKDLSLHLEARDSTAAEKSLRRQAETLMGPFVRDPETAWLEVAP